MPEADLPSAENKSQISMKKLSKSILLSVPLFFLAVACNSAQPVNDGQPIVHVTQSVAGGEQNQAIEFKVDEQKTALDLLKGSYQVQTKNFGPGLGEFVEEVNGVKPDRDEFWAFYVNGKSSNVGAGSYTPKDGDSLEWKLEKINESSE